jgi:hypothetical protein
VSETIKPRPNIGQLEALINETEKGEVEVLPNGDVVRLSPEELVKKQLRLEQERVEVLRGELRTLRDGLKRIVAEIEKLLPTKAV